MEKKRRKLRFVHCRIDIGIVSLRVFFLFQCIQEIQANFDLQKL